MSAIDDALARCRSVENTAVSHALQKRAGNLNVFDGSGSGAFGQFGQYQNQGENQRKYTQYRGWVYAAVNALAIEAAGQPAKIGRISGKGNGPSRTTKQQCFDEDFERVRSIKSFELDRMPKKMRSKAAATDLDIIEDHPLQATLEHPNNIQHNFQFVYSFVANLCLTGWGYVVGGYNEELDKTEFFSVPTTWVTPIHTKGAFAEFKIQNPNVAPTNDPPIPRENVRFAHLPNPSNPFAALAPASAQSLAIKIDDQIQSTQAVFFENSVFPGSIVTMGKNPHPDAPGGGVRPRLTAAQRRQVYGAIKKVMGGVANYGNPVIVDGMIESIERLSAAQNEIGWEKSEKSVRTRILSAFSVHPFILGEEMAGSYAQAFVVRDIFVKRVNVYLSLLSELMTGFAPDLVETQKAAKPKKKPDKLVIWWEEATAKDPAMEEKVWTAARDRGDVTQNEYRAWMGLAPDEDKNDSTLPQKSTQIVATIAAQVTKGELQPEQAEAILIAMGLPNDVAKKIAGDGPPEPAPGESGDVDEWGNPVASDQGDPNADPFQQQMEDAVGKLEAESKALLSMEDVIEKSTGVLVISDENHSR